MNHPGVTRLRTETLNDRRLFAEFGVSEDGYVFALVSGRFSLIPKSQSSGLLEKVVFTVATEKDLTQTKRPLKVKIGGAVESPATGNLFEGLAGEINGNTSFAVEGGTVTGLKHLVIRIYARGSDISSPAPNSGVLLRCTVKQTGNFEQKP